LAVGEKGPGKKKGSRRKNGTIFTCYIKTTGGKE